MSVLESLARSTGELRLMQDNLNQHLRNSLAAMKYRIQKAQQAHKSYVRLENRMREDCSRKLAEIESLKTKDKVLCTHIAAKTAKIDAIDNEVQYLQQKIEQRQKLLLSMATTTNDRSMQAEQITIKWDRLYTQIV